jgi:hypothetical protein
MHFFFLQMQLESNECTAVSPADRQDAGYFGWQDLIAADT